MSDIYHPSRAIVRNANVKEYEALYARSITDPQAFWSEEARKLKWFRKWQNVLDEANPPFYKWFTGGKINIIANAIDRHLETWRRNKLAIIWE